MNSLRVQLIAQIFMPLAILATLVLWLTFQTAEGLLEHRLEKEIELVARALREPVQQALRDGDRGRIEQALASVFDIDRIYGATVFDAEGRRLTVAGEIRPGWQEQAEAVEVAALGQELGRYAELGGEPVYSYFVPLTSTAGQIAGLLQVVRQESEIAQRLGVVRQRGWWLWGGVLILMFTILLLGHRLAIVRPVERLLVSMGKVEGGERGHRAEVEGPRELAALSRGLNNMLDAIESMQLELDRQRRERLLMSERMRQQESLAALGRFSSGVAHELGAPLSVIDGDARRLLQHDQLDEDGQRRLQRMRLQVDRTRQLIRQLMEFVRSDQREKQLVPLHRLLRRVLGNTSPQAEARDIECRIQDVDEALAITGFEIRLEHALINLVRNGIQAARSRVRVEVVATDKTVQLIIEDDGPGVPEAMRERIFEPFQSSREDGQGTGLGLAIVRTVVDEHDAEIEVGQSKSLGGGRFALTFGRA
ncbi:MAG: HAMP domain-containing protein [Wenzhouxiangella sp.]|nr:MAG: HAMP domain-containing protein [Wenzhouxiangella sp.]